MLRWLTVVHVAQQQPRAELRPALQAIGHLHCTLSQRALSQTLRSALDMKQKSHSRGHVEVEKWQMWAYLFLCLGLGSGSGGTECA